MSNIAGKIKVLIPSKIVQSALIEPLFSEAKFCILVGLTGFIEFSQSDAVAGVSGWKSSRQAGFQTTKIIARHIFVDSIPALSNVPNIMARAQTPPPGRLIVSIIYSSMDALADGLKALEKKFGRVQFETLEIECAEASEYREEMGDGLLRRFFSFEKEVPRDSLPALKAACSKIEAQFADVTDNYLFRTVNIDPGILTPSNVVIATHKEFNHRMYLRDGVYAELALIYSRGTFCRLPWTASDYCDEEAIGFFRRVRDSFEIISAKQESLKL